MGVAYPVETPPTSPRKTVITFLPKLYKRKPLLSHLLHLSYRKVSHPLISESLWSALTAELIMSVPGIHYLCSAGGVSRRLINYGVLSTKGIQGGA